ncbi:MAG: hypothetical protein QOJ54_162 [Aliidongia sp.]|nr:hypothetical protein [Aliidongia sp.]
MAKLAKKPAISSTAAVPPKHTAIEDAAGKTPDRRSKQSRVIAMLRSPAGATLAAIVKVTTWQPHSVRGFLAGVVRKRLKLKLASKKKDGHRVYRISGGTGGKAGRSKRPSS